jgi:hypothetical protein
VSDQVFSRATFPAVRALISLGFHLLANAVGLLVAALLLDDFSIEVTPFIFVVAAFTLVEVVLGPLITKTALKSAPALLGGIALVTTFVGLFITNLLFDSLTITGLSTWLLAVLIVWVASLLAAIVLPALLVKKGVQNARAN